VSSPDDVRRVEPLTTPPDAIVDLPGSKSITNRALLASALARGASTLRRVLAADDTDAMRSCVGVLGATITDTAAAGELVVEGTGGALVPSAELNARKSGTTARFLLPVLGLGPGPYRIDGHVQLRLRPMADGVDALRSLGARVAASGIVEHLPVEVRGGPVAGGHLSVRGDASSQFLSGLLLAAPVMPDGLVIDVEGPLVSEPYVAMTVSVMRAFGAEVERPDAVTWVVSPTGYDATVYEIEPDASAASYFFAAAALTGGRVTIGLGDRSIQGDVAFVDILERMGARVERTAERTTVTGTGELHGIDVDLRDLSDTAPTLAAVAAFADSPTRVSGIGFIRGKESNRIAAIVTELRRLGLDATEDDDGFVVQPGSIAPATIETYGDHRMAMGFALVGLRVPGVDIADPDCVAKTFPGFWASFDQLRSK
jgi:3-phosphoshikimate 1-carboxyvinyltransferase